MNTNTKNSLTSAAEDAFGSEISEADIDYFLEKLREKGLFIWEIYDLKLINQKFEKVLSQAI